MKQVIDLMGNIVSFEIKNPEKYQSDFGETTKIKGLVTGVALHLNGQHDILIKGFDDSEDYYSFSEAENFKILQIDPELFFENVKTGAIKVDF